MANQCRSTLDKKDHDDIGRTSLGRGRRLKGKGKGVWGKRVLCACPLRFAFRVSRFALSLPFQTPVTQAKGEPTPLFVDRKWKLNKT